MTFISIEASPSKRKGILIESGNTQKFRGAVSEDYELYTITYENIFSQDKKSVAKKTSQIQKSCIYY